MQIAFISDIHGNIDALKAVFKEIVRLKIKKIFCLGDILNYYYQPDKCIDILIKNNVSCIKGNHETVFFLTLKDKKKKLFFCNLYGNSIYINHKKLSNKHILFLKKLKSQKKITINKKKFLLAHGSPWNANFYFYPNSKKKWFNKIASYKFDYIILGHTHIPMKAKINKQLTVFNPGSVGQPRDKTCDASWLLLNTNVMKFKIMKSKYNKKNLKNKIKKYDCNNPKISKFFKTCN